MSERNAVLHRRILDISRPRGRAGHLRAAALAGRPLPVPDRARARPPAEVARRAPGDRRRDRRRDRAAAEPAMRTHLTHVAATLAEVAGPSRIAICRRCGSGAMLSHVLRT